MEKYHICSITGERYYGYGNNADPFYGRCSDYANGMYVIPARCMGITREDLDGMTYIKTKKERNATLKGLMDIQMYHKR